MAADDGIQRRPIWILVMGVPSALSALVTGLLLGSPPGAAAATAVTFGAVIGLGTFALNRWIGGRGRRG